MIYRESCYPLSNFSRAQVNLINEIELIDEINLNKLEKESATSIENSELKSRVIFISKQLLNARFKIGLLSELKERWDSSFYITREENRINSIKEGLNAILIATMERLAQNSPTPPSPINAQELS